MQTIIQDMLDASIHLGHRVGRWNPRMKGYIYGQKHGVHILDSLQTLRCLQRACTVFDRAGAYGRTLLFVGTKEQASPLLEFKAKECDGAGFYITRRWLGGFLTNWKTMAKSLQRFARMDRVLQQASLDRVNAPTPASDGQTLAPFSNESSGGLQRTDLFQIQKQHARLDRFLCGVKGLRRRPDLLIIVGQREEENAVRECVTLGLPNVTLLDTDCNPGLTPFGIPANDDAIPSLQFVVHHLVAAFRLGCFRARPAR